ncbi:MAG: histidine phosphatase family protein [Defluviitaleaceae bacterium]|nr:histidine phosphatase family protein [Defluviitaleaceae bacterium]
MKITTIRHGQSLWNIEGRMQGHADIALDNVGLAQGARVAARLAMEPCDIIYTSDLARASETARLIGAYHNVSLVPTAALREIGFGIYEGQVFNEVREEMARYNELGQNYPGSEDVADFFARISGFLDEITAKAHKNIFIVAHYGTIRAIICHFLGLTPADRHRYNITNTALHTFELTPTGNFAMTMENDASHVKEERHED